MNGKDFKEVIQRNIVSILLLLGTLVVSYFNLSVATKLSPLEQSITSLVKQVEAVNKEVISMKEEHKQIKEEFATKREIDIRFNDIKEQLDRIEIRLNK